jgi:hypothetical protein
MKCDICKRSSSALLCSVCKEAVLRVLRIINANNLEFKTREVAIGKQGKAASNYR